MCSSRAGLRAAAHCWRAGSVLLTLMLMFASVHSAMAAEPGIQSFLRTWERPDKPVASGQVSRTWMWGPEAFTTLLTEPYADASGGQRTVQYFDKSRMEDNAFRATSPWDVTNGLLVVELITGRMQAGDAGFEPRGPAEVNVAGDADDPTGPTYRTLQTAMDIPARGEGAYVMERIDREGYVTEDASLIVRNVTADHYVAETGHTVAGPFWTFMTSSGLVYVEGQYATDSLFPSPFYATGLPITEAYWANVKVAGTYQDVLLQCFERRCLTYTPGNPEGWQVEAGNVGLHYYAWRYGQGPGDDPTPTPDPSPTPTPESPIVDYTYLGAWDNKVTEKTAFYGAIGIAVGPSGDVYISESGSHRVRRFTADGVRVTSWGVEGDSPGQFNRPEGVATDADGNVYVAEYTNNRVQKFDQYGAYLGVVAGDAPGDLKSPMDLAVDPASGALIIVDHLNHRVQRYTGDGPPYTILTIGEQGSGQGQLSLPNGIGIDAAGNIFVADTGNHRVQKFSPNGEWIVSFGSQGKGAGEFTYPRDIQVGADGRVYVVNSGDQNGGASIKVWEPLNDEGTEYGFVFEWGETGAEPNQFNYPARIAVDKSNYLYVTELLNNRVQKFTTAGALVDAWSDGSRNAFSRPFEIDYGDDGNLYVVDKELHQVKVIAATGEFVRQWDLQDPVDVVMRDGYAYVVSQSQNAIFKYTSDGEYLTQWGQLGDGEGQFNNPEGVAVDEAGYVYVVDNGNYRIQKFTADGQFVTAWGSRGAGPGQFENSKDIAVHGDAVYVVDFYPARVQQFDLDGNYIREWGGDGDEPGQLDGPYAVSVDGHGYVYVADRDNHRIQKFTADGEFLAMLTPETTGMPAYSAPIGVAVSMDGMAFAVSDLLRGVTVFGPAPAN